MNLPSRESCRSFRERSVSTQTLARPPRSSVRTAFTLVELMMVIVIIGILAGLAIPAVMRAISTAKEGSVKQEIDTLADAVEKYRTKYGDYPPDGSSWQIMERHLRKAFPQILASELNLLNPGNLAYQGWGANSWTNNGMVTAGVRNDFDVGAAAGLGKVMDPAEALVFFLGGFSSDPKRPFTGPGGPFVVVAGTAGSPPPATGLSAGQTLQVNSQRSNAFFEFKPNRLTVVQTGTVTYSNDEEAFLGLTAANDLLPVYLSDDDIQRSSPIVYFDSRTYLQATAGGYVNYYQRSPTAGTLTEAQAIFGAVRPLVSQTLRLPPPTGTTAYDYLRQNLFMEDKKFQVIGPGLDGMYGGLNAQDMGTTVNDIAGALILLPSGNSYKTSDMSTGPANDKKYVGLRVSKTSHLHFERSTGLLDNAANCTERTFLNTIKAPGQ